MNWKLWKRRAQISVEYLIITGFAFAILIPGIYFFYSYSKGSTSEVTASQFNFLGEEMMKKVLKTSSQGKGSFFTLETTIPDNIYNITIDDANDEITISYRVDDGITEAVFFSTTDIVADDQTPFINQAHPGKTYFRFTKESAGLVRIAEVLP